MSELPRHVPGAAAPCRVAVETAEARAGLQTLVKYIHVCRFLGTGLCDLYGGGLWVSCQDPSKLGAGLCE